jgi:hypothetical protein
VLVAALLATVVGCSSSTTPAAVNSPSSSPTPSALFTQAGTGDVDLAGPFTTTGNWWLAWAYDCSAVKDGHNWLIVAVYRQSDADASTAALFDTITPAPGGGDAGTVSGEARESHDTTAGPPAGKFFLKVSTECSWHIVVKAAP